MLTSKRSCLRLAIISLAGLFLIWLAGCNLPNGTETAPTMDVTQAYQTVEARLTDAVALTPSPTTEPTATETVMPTATETPNLTPSNTVAVMLPSSTATTGQACDQASPGNPIDVTIPDDTVMAPGQTFSKTWRLRNAGTCTWTTGYSIVWFSGEQLEAPTSVALTSNVAPGQTVDVTVDMVAPQSPGTYQSNWKLRNASNVLFGIGPGEGLPFYVRIIVSPSTTTTPTGSPTITLTPTPGAHASGTAILFPSDRLNLDNNQVNSGGEDLLFEFNEGEERYYLVPLDGAVAGVYGGFQPGQQDCQAANLGAAPIALQDLALGTHLCYQTNEGRFGWARLSGWNTDNNRLDLAIYTWATP
jgi:hypothetical protein